MRLKRVSLFIIALLVKVFEAIIARQICRAIPNLEQEEAKFGRKKEQKRKEETR